MQELELGSATGNRKPFDLAQDLARGVQRRWSEFGYGTLAEFRVGQGRRVDVCALNREGHFVVVEIKTSVADFRSDGKWPDYLPFCDAYYFAVPSDFPREILPPEHGLIVAGISSRDSGEARRAMREHLTRSLERYRKLAEGARHGRR